MPVRSLSSPVLKWPESSEVEEAARRWALRAAEKNPGLIRLGVFGSYARGDAGVGSDLDLIAMLEDSSLPFERRGVDWDLTDLPVPAEIVVYTREEWDRLKRSGGRFATTIDREARWIFERE